MQQAEGFWQTSLQEIFLEHGVTSTDHKLVCSLAMVSRDWRAAVLKTPISRLHVNLKTPNIPDPRRPPADNLPGHLVTFASSFAQWLLKHAELVSRLQINNVPGYLCRCEPPTDLRLPHATGLVPALSMALHAAAATCPQIGAEWQLRPLGLHSYSSWGLDDSAVLQALPVASVTHLDISGGSASDLAAAVLRLTSLQSVSSTWVKGGLDGYMAALAQLSRLTSFTLSRSRSDYNKDCRFVDQLPPQLLGLYLRLADVKGSDIVDLRHLTRLTGCQLEMDWSAASKTSLGGYLAVTWRLPPQIVELSLSGGDRGPFDFGWASQDSPAFNVMSLERLQRLRLVGTTITPKCLLQAGKLPNLQSLALKYHIHSTEGGEEIIKATAPVWQRWQQLQDLESQLCHIKAASIDWVQQLGRVSGLTQLDLHTSPVQQQDLIALCKEVAKLQSLQNLSIYTSGAQQHWAKNDSCYAAHHLSCLTQLTKLILWSATDWLCHDEVIMELALRLKQLRKLQVPVESSTTLVVISDLKYLESLVVWGLPAAEQQAGLQHLHGLKRLTELQGFDQCGKDALADFWSAVRG